MPQSETIEIYYSKTAYRLMVFVSVMICLLGIGTMTAVTGGEQWSPTIHPFTGYGLLGLGIIVLGVLLCLAYLKRLSINEPAIIIDNDGITLNHKEQINIGWDKVSRIEVLITTTKSESSYTKNKFLVPVLKNPEEYYNNLTKKLVGTLENYNIKANASQPIQISTTFLKCSFDELKDLLETKLVEYNAKK